MFKVFEKGRFYCEKEDRDLTEREFVDDETSYAVMRRDGQVVIIEHSCYGVCDFHCIENDNDSRFRVERIVT